MIIEARNWLIASGTGAKDRTPGTSVFKGPQTKSNPKMETKKELGESMETGEWLQSDCREEAASCSG